ncbi:MAG: SirB2 family protein [Halieaceae bacterium]|jgi:uncharacterized membrane protein SirB2|nr:SirB2 family protein [Halieaceae bacterium]
MTLFALLKCVHVTCALLSISGFTLRCIWMYRDTALLEHRLAKVLPHIVDTLLLGSAVGMLFLWQTFPFALPWLNAKIFLLLIYIGLGMVALRFGKTKTVRGVAALLALLTAFYIVAVATTQSVKGPLLLF